MAGSDAGGMMGNSFLGGENSDQFPESALSMNAAEAQSLFDPSLSVEIQRLQQHNTDTGLCDARGCDRYFYFIWFFFCCVCSDVCFLFVGFVWKS